MRKKILPLGSLKKWIMQLGRVLHEILVGKEYSSNYKPLSTVLDCM